MKKLVKLSNYTCRVKFISTISVKCMSLLPFSEADNFLLEYALRYAYKLCVQNQVKKIHVFFHKKTIILPKPQFS